MLKNYKEFLFEIDLNMDPSGGGGEDKEKKEKPLDPEKEIAAAKAKKRKAEKKERNAELDKAEAELKEVMPKTAESFRDKFEDRVYDSIDKDDRVIYHDLILDIQAWGVPLVKNGQGDDVESAGPVVKILQGLNNNEYRG